MSRYILILLLFLLVGCQTATPQPTATPIPTSVLLPEPRTGRPIKGDHAEVYRVMENNRLRHIVDLRTYTALGYQAHDLVHVPQSELTTYEIDPPLTRWLTGKTDTDLYYLQRGMRYKIRNRQMLHTTGGTPQDVTQVEDAFLHSFPLADARLEAAEITYETVEQNALSTIAIEDTWIVESSYYDMDAMRYHIERGLIQRKADNSEQLHTLNDTANDPLKHVTALTLDTSHQKLWVGTRFAGLLAYDLTAQTWQHYTIFNSQIGANQINAVAVAKDGTIWVALPSGISRFNGTNWRLYTVPDDITSTGALSVAASNSDVWIGGQNYVARINAEGKWQMFSAFDHPLLLDRFSSLDLDDQGNPVFAGDQRTIHYVNGQWSARDLNSEESTPFEPGKPTFTDIAFPDPTQQYTDWLKTWPRPERDNGRGIHYLTFPSDDRFELHQQLQRMKRLNIRWLLVNYTSRSQLLQMAPVFKEAGIMVIWRPFVRPYVQYRFWKQDVIFLRAMGIPPYMQIYNEPSLGQEWEDKGKPIDQQVYLDHALPAMREVFDAGGYVGLQHIDLDWLRATLKLMKDKQMLDILPRFYFIPHTYGFNHPPDYDDDVNGVLGFREFANVFKQEIGFVPMMIAGEGGWRPDEMQDIRYPIMTQTRYRDYTLAVLNWFQSGALSNGELLPDYFFAFCPWILSDPVDRAAWFDSIQGTRILLVQAVENLPAYERRFSWNNK